LTTLEQQTITETSSCIHEHWLNGRKGKTRYWLSEPRQGQPLLLIHGYGALIEHWRRLMPLLQEQHTVCAFDLHNFGYSSPLNGQPSGKAWAQQAAQIIESVLQEPPIVIGHSMGGMVAAQLAHDYPQLVRGLVLTNSVGLPPERSPNALEQAFIGMVRAPVLGEILAEVVTNSWAVKRGLQSAYYNQEQVTPDLVEAFSGPLRKRGGPKAYLAVSRSFGQYQLDFAPGTVQQPTLLIWGEHDRSMPATQAEKFRQRFLPQAQISIIPDSAHCPFDEVPQAFADVVLPWIDTAV
jgi:pimeloyl-ACP methyl ester carboxylesterase